MNSLATRLLPHRQHLAAVARPNLCSLVDAIQSPAPIGNSNGFHTSAALHRRPGGGWKERNPKIGITLEQLRMAARGNKRRLPICHAEQEKVMNALEAAKYENSAIYKYVLEYDKCREDYELHHKGKDKVMMRELNKYLVQRRKGK
ncbi:hypothetical protein ACHAXT_008409 [Thalassiosira profunda]